MTSIVDVGDTTGDGKADLVARDTAGNLWLYAGKGRRQPGAEEEDRRGLEQHDPADGTR